MRGIWATATVHAVRAPAVRPPKSTRLTQRLRFTAGAKPPCSTEHRRGDDEADAENDRTGHDGRRDIAVFQDLLAEISGRAFVEELVARDGRDNSDHSKKNHVADGFAEAFGMPARARRGVGGGR